MKPRPGAAPAPRDDAATQVFRAQLRLAFELLPVALAANTVLTLAVCAVLYKVTPSEELVAWAAVMLGLIGVRVAAVASYRRSASEGRDDQRYARWYFIPYAFSGLGWAVMATCLVPAEPQVYPVLAMCAIYGLAAGGVAFLGHMRHFYGIFLLAILVPAAAKWLADWWDLGGDFRLVMGITTLVFVVLLYSAARQLSSLVAGSVAARLEKEALARRLQELVATVERANQAKGDFIARMSRQVYTPAQALAGQAAELLDGAQAPDPARRETLEGLRDGAQALLGMLGDVLDYSSLEAGRLEIERAPFDLHALLARSGQAAGESARARGLTFSLNVDAQVPARVVGDSRRLGQILANLLANAVHFTRQGNVALDVRSVSVEGARHTLSFAVRDTGVGIASQRLGEIFQPFVANAAGAAPAEAGSGLGLAICRRLAGLMQGAIAVQSEPGLGSVFTLMLSLQAAEDA
jgi:signal transduction histidine kinase